MWEIDVSCMIMSSAADTSQLVGRHSLADKLTVTQEESESVETQLIAAKEDSIRKCDGCCHFKNHLTAIRDQLRSDVVLANCALQKVQEPGILLGMPLYHKCDVNLAHKIAEHSFIGGASQQVDAMVKAATDAMRALIAALEFQHQRALQLDLNVSHSLGNDMRTLCESLFSLHSSLSDKRTAKAGKVAQLL